MKMSESVKKAGSGTVEQIIEHMTADLQNSDGQYIQLGFTPPPTPSDAHIWQEYTQNQLPQNPFVHYSAREQEPINYIDANSCFMPYNNFISQNSIYVSDLQNNGFDKHVNIDVHGNKYVLYQGQSPQYVMSKQDIPIGNFLPIYPENHECNGFPNNEMQSNSTANNKLFMTRNRIIPQNHPNNINSKIVLQQNQNRTHLIDNLVGNWTSNTNGTYSPFGNVQNQDASNFFDRKKNLPQNPVDNPTDAVNNDFTQKKSTIKKQKQVAEVKPMRPTYSDVLTKAVPIQTLKQEKTDLKYKDQTGKKNSKGDKFSKINLNRQLFQDSKECSQKFSDKSQSNKKINLSRKWVSLDDVNDIQTNKKFLKTDTELTNNQSKSKKSKKTENTKCDLNSSNVNKNSNCKKLFHDNGSLDCKWMENEESNENSKNEEKNVNNKNPVKKVKEIRSSSARQSKFNDRSNEKPPNTVKKNQRIRKKDNNNSLGLFGKNVQHYLNRWFKVIFICLSWFLNLISDIFSMSVHLVRDFATFLWDLILIYSKLLTQNTWQTIKKVKFLTKIGFYIDKIFGRSRWAFWNRWTSNEKSDRDKGKSWLNSGLEHNINMPTTGEEAMKRLLACKGKDPYSILGVRSDCTDDDIKRYYKRQAFLVHPDKNSQPGAEEAFKILVHAFDIIGEPERRKSYDRKVAESHQVEQAWSELNDLLSQLHQKMEYAANTIRCTNCTKRHRRIAVDRPCYAARLCAQCKIHHSAKEGDIWAEATCLGFLWHYYACMDGAVYDITEWAGCQRKNLKHLRPNSHNVQYRIVLGKHSSHSGQSNLSSGGQSGRRYKGNGGSTSERETDFENFLNNLYNQSDLSASAGTGNTKTHTDTGNTSVRNRKKNKRKNK